MGGLQPEVLMSPAQLLKGDTRIKSGYDGKDGRHYQNIALAYIRLQRRSYPALCRARTCVRCIRRRCWLSKLSRRCMVTRLSHMTRSPLRQECAQVNSGLTTWLHNSSSSASPSAIDKPTT